MTATALEIRTHRLLLVAGNVALSRAEIEDRSRFSTLLGATVAPEWPPPLNDDNSMRWSLRFHQAHPDGTGWGNWYFLRVLPEGHRIAVGNGGFQGDPTADGQVEIGYSVLASHQRQGYAPEAVRALLAWAFAHPEVHMVRAHTLPELVASIRVLEKCGFRPVGPGVEEGTLRYEVPRSPTALDPGARPS
ncbi:MAG TPA: GNAT family N-acetyltransferase [Candidatus Krumholzibacteria bacterium]|nr:GNAT family N-acetyltransferase [Candidatus Krumholzibacteria bacterium]